jgi:hypothetical protein
VCHLENIIVCGMMMCSRGDGAGSLSIPDHNVSIRPHQYGPLLWENIKDLGSICTGHGHKATWTHLPCVHALLPYNGHPILQAIHSVGNLAKVLGTLGRKINNFKKCLLIN